jgi:hypothetical protein
MRGRPSLRTRATLASASLGLVACGLLAVSACAAFDAESVAAVTPDGEGGPTGGNDGAPSIDDAGGPARADGPLDGPLAETGVATDAAIGPFAAACDATDLIEIESNDQEGTATSFTRGVCGELLGDPLDTADWFRVVLTGIATLKVAYNTTGDAKLLIRRSGTGDSQNGSSPNGGYRYVETATVTPPGTYFFRFDGATVQQTYRLVVTH